MVRVKICGIRHAEDATVAAEAGASALGFNFWKGSSRYIDPPEAAHIIASVPRQVCTVGVFVNEAPEQVLEIAAATGISVLQFHGDESPEYWDRFDSFRKIKAFRIESGFDPLRMIPYRSAMAYLLDGAAAGKYGGTGETFDWSLAEKAKSCGEIILAGGLNAMNIGEAVRRVHPWAVDVCSGVETRPGTKDARLIREFMKAVHAAEGESVRAAK